MQVGKVNNVSFGYKLTPNFVKASVVSGNSDVNLENAKLLTEIRNAGSDNITLDYKKGFFDDNYYMIFPKKYKFKQIIYPKNSAYNLSKSIIEDYEKSGITKILGKAIKKGNLDKVAESLLADFPDMKEHIEEISNNPVLKELFSKNLKSNKAKTCLQLEYIPQLKYVP